uniref:J domain-containing protein n=1 Tax=Daucus carota subsp. sativus TaxID=79200 RepID=A0A164SJ60_DAUCS
MVRIGERSEGGDKKSQLVINICNISNRAIGCAHWHRRRGNVVPSPFIDWYLLLQVEENVGMDVIRKQYHKFGKFEYLNSSLLLHPDKNKHPKAGIAFKLVYEAYACLSDDTKRASFDLERGKNICSECNKLPTVTRNPSVKNSKKLRALFSLKRFRSNKNSNGMNDIKAKFKEEVGVIEQCLKINGASRKEFPSFNSSTKEIPVFNPSDYLAHGYPYYRSRNYTKADSYWSLQRGNCDYPIFESRSDKPLKLESVCLG